MFTGIVEEVGRLRAVSRKGVSARLGVEARRVLEGTRVGDSIAVNGVCLTVTALGEDGFEADVMQETLRRSALGRLRPGSPLNLERALAADGRFGGHIVAGHADGVGVLQAAWQEGNARWLQIGAEAKILRYVVEKGSIAVDGVSLTVARVEKGSFSVSAIPHTLGATALGRKDPGEPVNLEVDVIGKYVEKLLGLGGPPGRPPLARPGLSRDFLQENGF